MQMCEKPHLNALCRVSKLFHKLATTFLYESLEIKCPEGLNPRLDVLKYFSPKGPHVDSFSSLKCVRNLALTTDYQELLRTGFRCWHQRCYDEEWEKRRANTDNGTGKCRHGNVVRSASYEEAGFRNWNPGSECACERHTEEFENDKHKGQDSCEGHFQDFCTELSENSLRSFR